MPKNFIVQPVAEDGSPLDRTEVSASTAEDAAHAVTGERLKRGQPGFRGVLKAKVYEVDGELRTLRRLYRR